MKTEGSDARRSVSLVEEGGEKKGRSIT